MISMLPHGLACALAKRSYIQFLIYALLSIGLASFHTEAMAANSCKVSYSIASQWNNGFTANVTLTNTGDPWSSWQATWTMPNQQQITGLWNGAHSQTANAVTVKNLSWNASVNKNANVQFGFNGSHTGVNALPSNVSVNGVLCEGNAPAPKPAVVACDVSYNVTSTWDTGFTADVKIKNTGDALSNWTVTWDMPNEQRITGFWNGQYQQTNNKITVAPADWNRTIAAASQLQFGFNASHIGLNNAPGNISVNGVKCTGQVNPPPPPPPACSVKYLIQNQWDNGFTGTVEIKNTGAPWNGWQTTWTMPTEQKVTQGWNGQFSQTDDKVLVKNLDYNKIIALNGSIAFGFNASHTGLNLMPIDVAVNGTRCGGQADNLVYPPKAPSSLALKLVDNTYVDLTWTDNSKNETKFVLERRANNGSWLNLANLDNNSTTYRDSSLVIATAYDYRLKAINDAGASAYTEIVSGKRQDRTDIRAAMLVNNCATCHGTDGYSSGSSIPSIAGLNKTYLVRTMQAYRSGTRASSVMARIAKGYTDTQIERMADYLSKLPYKAATQSTIPALVARGKAVHETNCAFCHTGTGNDATLTRTLLDGQWATYLHATLEDYYLGRSSNVPTEMAHQLADLKAQQGEDILWALAQYYAADATAKAGGTSNNGGNNNSGNIIDGNTNTNVSPSAPSNFSATVVDNSKVNLNWQDNSANETGFKVERRLSNSSDADWSLLAEVASNLKTYTDSSVAMGQSYDYRVSAFNAAGTSASSSASASLQTTLIYGQSQYQRQGCASCHGADGKGGFTNLPLTKYSSSQLAELSKLIHDTMPPGNLGACSNSCATAIAQYIIDNLVPNANGANNNTNQTCADMPPAATRSLRLLTRQEYQNTVNDLLGLQLDLLHKLPEENRVDGFDNNVEQNQITSLRLEAYMTQAEQLASQAVLQSWEKILPCTQQDAACGRQFVQSFGKRAFRRPLTTTEVDQYASAFSGTTAGVTFKDAVETAVMRFLMSPNFLYRSELGELQANGTYKLSPYEVASSLSYLFWGSMPDDALFQAAAQNALDTPQQRITQASRLLAAARSRQQVGNFVGQWLLKTNPYFLPAKDSSVYPAYTDAVRMAMSQELINFFNFVAFDSTQGFRELYAADYVLANKTLADFYNISGVTDNNFVKAPVTDGSRHGVLTLGAVLARYANSNESHPFKRGRFFFERVLCHDLPEPANMGVVQAPDPDPNMTTRERFVFHSNSGTSCFSCHQYLDGPGFNFENYDGSGQFRLTENGSLIDAAGILRGLETYTPSEQQPVSNLSQLSNIVADSPTAARCLGKQYYRYATGRRETTADSCALNSYLDTYEASGYNLQTLLLSIVNTPNFTLRRAQ